MNRATRVRLKPCCVTRLDPIVVDRLPGSQNTKRQEPGSLQKAETSAELQLPLDRAAQRLWSQACPYRMHLAHSGVIRAEVKWKQIFQHGRNWLPVPRSDSSAGNHEWTPADDRNSN